MVIFFYGPNSFLSRQKLNDLMQTYVTKAGSDLNLIRLDGSSVTYDQLVNEVTSAPFLATTRLVVVDRLSANKTVSQHIPDLIAKVPESTNLVLYETEVDSRTVYFKTLSKLKLAQRFEPLSQGQLKRWVKERIAVYGGEATDEVVELLIGMVGEEMYQLEQEVVKLVTYQSKITAAAIKKLVTANFNQTVFNLVESVAAGKLGPALELYDQLLEGGETEIHILALVIWQWRTLLLAKVTAREDIYWAAKETGTSPYALQKAAAVAGRHTLEEIKRGFELAVEMDYLVKSGKIEARLGVESLIRRIAGFGLQG